MNVVVADDYCIEWDSFVTASPDATAYHVFAWKNVLSDSFGHKSYYLAAIDEVGIWQGILPLVHMQSMLFGNFLISLPFLNYGGLLCNNDSAASSLLQEAERICRTCDSSFVELRHISPKASFLPTKQHKVTMILALAKSEDVQWCLFDSKLRNQIRKAQKSGLEFRVGRQELLVDFYAVFARNMRDLGTPVYAQEFFENVIRAFPDSTSIGAVYHDGKAIAAGLVCWFRGKIEIPWASSILDYKAFCPNHMLYWELIKFAIAHGQDEFDFGRSTPHEGTYNFKKQWGAKPIQLNWQYLKSESGEVPELNPKNPKFKLAIQIWRHLPVSVTKLIGPPIVRNIP